MNKDCHLIFEAYTSPGVPTVPTSPSTTNIPLQQAVSKPTTPVSSSTKAEEAEKKAKEKPNFREFLDVWVS